MPRLLQCCQIGQKLLCADGHNLGITEFEVSLAVFIKMNFLGFFVEFGGF